MSQFPAKGLDVGEVGRGVIPLGLAVSAGRVRLCADRSEIEGLAGLAPRS